MKPTTSVLGAALVLALQASTGARPLLGQTAAVRVAADAMVPSLTSEIGATTSELRDIVERFTADRAALLRRYDAEYSAERRSRLRDFYTAWRSRLRELDFDKLSQDGKIDYILLDNELRYQLELLDREEKLFAEMRPLLPFASEILALHEARRRMETMDPARTASKLNELARAIEAQHRSLEAAVGRGSPGVSRIVAFRAAGALESMRRTLEGWYQYYAGYDPLFTWWAAAPYRAVDESLRRYTRFLRERVVGIREGEEEPIIGDPIGRDGMRADLAHEMIPYTPEELVAIAEREFAWCEAEARKAAREMGLGDDWKAAVERVKNLHVEPGKQTDLVRDLAHEAVAFLKEHDLITIPPLAEEIWRMEMMSPERQRVNPFFTGGEVIRVSYPTDGMSHEDKLMSMRGNNIHFSRATVHHELIPGHHLEGYMTARYNSHRRLFTTPFWVEGWALYWEMLLWDLGFPKTPEDRVGMLFWRMHRAARIIFSLNFHLGKMTPQQAIDFLVERVGHERANAEAEVRRSFNGSYPPLYQAAYMLGGLQLRALYRELVESGKMTPRQFHDAVLRSGRMPIEMLRARLTGQPLTRDYVASWRFADPIRTAAGGR
ncbi:MAG TPA: DUF885 domain-containing protein [Longimicrobiales bacterium]